MGAFTRLIIQETTIQLRFRRKKRAATIIVLLLKPLKTQEDENKHQWLQPLHEQLFVYITNVVAHNLALVLQLFVVSTPKAI